MTDDPAFVYDGADMAGLTVRPRVSLLLTALTVCVSSATQAGENWPTFRGSDRSAVSSDTGLLERWPEEGPPLLWKGTGAGRGYAELAVADGRIYTLGDAPSTADDKDEYLVCFDQKTGEQIWRTKTGAPWTEGKPDWQSSRATPSVDGDLVFVLTPQGELVCCKTEDGAEVWRKNLPSEFGGVKADSWGYSESVLVDGDHVVCTPGGEKSTMVALNKRTGDLVWTCVRPGDTGAGHSSIVKTDVGGTKVYVQSTGLGPMGVRASDGTLLWSVPIEKTTAVIPTPVVRDNFVFFVAGYKRGGMLLKQTAGADSTVTVEEIYPLNIKLANKHGGVVLVGDYLYGDSDDAGIPYCANLMTGEIQWAERGSGRGSASVAAADGHLYFLFSNGKICLVPANPEKYEEVSSFQVPGSGDRPSWSHPVIVGGKLYLREQDSILCYDLRKISEKRASR
ncbi:PQQ-binding-like beta-propeller repeat protein [Planctomicrobium sp. SH661]|uniref:PQQ-binding-like beta-propeller repeat protein n=1 Tax=Planctomicrobium sp. SH661 TaxID=3448124 RepID=UPI003F5C1D70